MAAPHAGVAVTSSSAMLVGVSSWRDDVEGGGVRRQRVVGRLSERHHIGDCSRLNSSPQVRSCLRDCPGYGNIGAGVKEQNEIGVMRSSRLCSLAMEPFAVM